MMLDRTRAPSLRVNALAFLTELTGSRDRHAVERLLDEEGDELRCLVLLNLYWGEAQQNPNWVDSTAERLLLASPEIDCEERKRLRNEAVNVIARLRGTASLPVLEEAARTTTDQNMRNDIVAWLRYYNTEETLALAACIEQSREASA
jgi:hypothetical protein